MKRAEFRKWKSFDFGPESQLNSKSCTKDEKPRKKPDKRQNPTNVGIKHSFNFHKKLIPKSVEDLAVHPKKVGDIEEWLTLNVLNERMKCPFLLISGPTGSGKTTTLNVLCRKLGISVSEWVNPTDQDYELFRGSNQINRFVEFLTDSKWNSLFETEHTRKITLIKDFPNFVIRQPEEFSKILEECYVQLKYPIVFVCTDASNNSINLIRTLFTDDITNKYNIATISFNACAASLMKKAVKRAQGIVQGHPNLYRQPSPSTIDAILATGMGDIRNVMNQIHISCLLGTGDPPTSKDTGTVSNKRKRTDKAACLKFMSRDENLGLFHGLGRVLNPKRKQLGDSWRLNCDVEKLVEEFSVQPTSFISFLFENYLKYFGNLNEANEAAQVLSFTITFFDNWTDKQDTMVVGLWIAVLGLMVHNEHRVSKWNQIRGPTRINNYSSKDSEGKRLDPMDGFYYDFIRGSGTFHKFEN